MQQLVSNFDQRHRDPGAARQRGRRRVDVRLAPRHPGHRLRAVDRRGGRAERALLRPRLGQPRRHRLLRHPAARGRPAVRGRAEGGGRHGPARDAGPRRHHPRGRQPADRRSTRRRSPTLVALTNAPSDNYFAETLLKDLGARYGSGGTTADGVAVVRSQLAQSFGIHPRLDDGSGLSRYDRTTPLDVVTLLRQHGCQPAVHRLARGRRGDRHAAGRDARAPTPRAAAAARPGPCTTSPTWSATARPATATRSRTRS